MKKIFFPFLLLLAAAAVNETTAQKTRLRVITYNIHHANPPSKPGAIDVDAVAAALARYSPDLVALQEVDVNTNRSGKNMNEAAAIAEKLHMHYYFGKAIDFGGGAYGIAILSKYPLGATTTIALPSATAQAEKRALVMATVKLNTRTAFVFSCTHLDAEQGDESRLLQMATIDSVLGKQKLPVLLAGDFNSEPNNPVITQLDKRFTRTCTVHCPNSFPNLQPDKLIDYIAFRKRDRFKTIKHEVLPENYASDHLPVMADLQLK